MLPTITSAATVILNSSDLGPARAVAGTGVVLMRTNLVGVTSVRVNGVQVAPYDATSTSVSFVLPAGAGPTQSLTVTSPAGTSAPFTGFTAQFRVAQLFPQDSFNGTVIQVNFSESVAAASFTPGRTAGIRAYPAQAERLRGTFALNESRKGATFPISPPSARPPTAQAFLRVGEQLSVSVPATVQKAGGLGVAQWVYQFLMPTGGTGRGNF